MKKQDNSSDREASKKCNPEPVSVQFDLPLLDLILETKAEIEALSAQAGLEIIRRVLEEEIRQQCGPHGRQCAYRHGSQPGYVVYAGRKVHISKPRVRNKGAGEVSLRTYQAFQQDGRMQRAVARNPKVLEPAASKQVAAVPRGGGVGGERIYGFGPDVQMRAPRMGMGGIMKTPLFFV